MRSFKHVAKNYIPIKADLSEVDETELNMSQEVLLEVCCVIISGISESVAQRNHGKILYSRGHIANQVVSL